MAFRGLGSIFQIFVALEASLEIIDFSARPRAGVGGDLSTLALLWQHLKTPKQQIQNRISLQASYPCSDVPLASRGRRVTSFICFFNECLSSHSKTPILVFWSCPKVTTNPKCQGRISGCLKAPCARRISFGPLGRPHARRQVRST